MTPSAHRHRGPLRVGYRVTVPNPRLPVGRDLLYGVYKKRLRSSLPPDSLPNHVAMIIDGNRRWARQRALETAAHGHRAGAAKVHEFLQWCDELGVRHVTLYLLSQDNLVGRDSSELTELIAIIADLAEEVSQQPDWRVQHVGSDEGLPASLVTALDTAEARTASHTGLHVNLAVGYGGRHEIAQAVRSILEEHGKRGSSIEDVAGLLTPELIGEHLYTSGQPDPDLVIRTSGEQRLSDFMLWQSAHSEFYFMEALGPDIREVDFLRALRDYAGRHRRFGS
ncbi:isoprenyl transferase [Rathayibacter rathayi]|uniref:Isoprenyl transferase n=1 Tax=Rathayibacter rathayi TaxID=33887 RepID=A0ABD6WDI0_RATRA|nr:isoprenyl transferase [Rathayibacter rathayi]MWV73343.1 isoprenyl transferase [Rathayibacter rathayi NCPPB 2980 = VKM Ac-1601]PPF16416.1 isoprenyl transferase [Rathayibacter rathayi]PPF22295.1 isoprenyl transferase [Rathayibacter rathayi]PPF52007.1 isoprenyl transferase [Rathayibacter rathayi]